MQESTIDRLAIVIAYQWQARGLLKALKERKFAATVVDAVGGLLREGMVTLVVGTPERRLASLFVVIRNACPGSTRFIPFDAEMEYPWLPESELVVVRAGGANVFVLPIEDFVQL
jgi:uncharacterized protein YaaQ